jgi:multiple sugar transport system ATP-binding protein
VTFVPPHRREVAMVFQSYALYPQKTVFENIAFGLRLRKVKDADVRRLVAEAAEQLEITHLLDRRPAALSGGQRQRVALGRAIVRKPTAFLMDEPLSNLDAALRVAMRVLIKRLHQTMRTTFVYVTHDQAEAMTMADRIVVMRHGVIQHLGTPHDVYHRPKSMFVASFLGSPQINLVDGVLDGTATGTSFVRGDLRIPLDHAALAAQGGREVVLGVRPEDVRVGAGGFSGAVELVSPLGSEQFVNVRVAGVELVVRLDKDVAVAPGDRLELRADPKRLHVFDRQNGQSLRPDPAG